MFKQKIIIMPKHLNKPICYNNKVNNPITKFNNKLTNKVKIISFHKKEEINFL